MFKFRLMTPEDFPQMLDWLLKEHVKKWWDDSEDTLEKVALHYGAEDEAVRFVLIEIKENLEKPIGYFQYYLDYFASDGLIGIDQFIGEENYLNKGVGTNTIKMFVEMIVRQHKPKAIIIDPSPENKRAIRCYEKVGFKHYENKKDENGNPAYMMRLEIR